METVLLGIAYVCSLVSIAGVIVFVVALCTKESTKKTKLLLVAWRLLAVPTTIFCIYEIFGLSVQ